MKIWITCCSGRRWRVRKRMDLELVTNPTRAKKLITRPTTLHWDIITENLISIKKQKPKIIVDRPIYLGFAYWNCQKSQCINFITRKFWVRIACQTGLHRYGLFHISHPNAGPLQRHGGQHGCVWHFRLSDRPPPLLENECQGPMQDEGRMLQFVTARICWTSCKNVQHSPSQW